MAIFSLQRLVGVEMVWIDVSHKLLSHVLNLQYMLWTWHVLNQKIQCFDTWIYLDIMGWWSPLTFIFFPGLTPPDVSRQERGSCRETTRPWNGSPSQKPKADMTRVRATAALKKYFQAFLKNSVHLTDGNLRGIKSLWFLQIDCGPDCRIFSLRVSNAHFYALKGSESPAEPELAQLVHTGGKCTRM